MSKKDSIEDAKPVHAYLDHFMLWFLRPWQSGIKRRQIEKRKKLRKSLRDQARGNMGGWIQATSLLTEAREGDVKAEVRGS